MDKKELRSWKKVYQSDLENLINEFREALDPSCLIILSGEVGAGKTTFTQIFCDKKDMSSPSYALVQEWGNIAHADFYRLEEPEEIIHLEIPLYLDGKEYFLVEWGEKYLAQLMREIPEKFKIYQLEIQINPKAATDQDHASRNYILSQIVN